MECYATNTILACAACGCGVVMDGVVYPPNPYSNTNGERFKSIGIAVLPNVLHWSLGFPKDPHFLLAMDMVMEADWHRFQCLS